ncbi:MAG: fibrobacter succinogenes major paralogous domain-containing protein [Fibrobacter sp.]|nr:fibrobacter succinogenes major paralogous domain-containing protein [Fibrobacter sp.]
MRFNFIKVLAFATVWGAFSLTACDSDSTSANSNTDEEVSSSSSEFILSSSQNQQSSSSVKSESSSSVILDPDPGSSSSSAESSSSSIVSGSSELSSCSAESSSAAIEIVDPSTVIKGTMTDERDGRVYKTVTIGSQTWMAENLNYAYTGVRFSFSGYTSDSTSWCYDNKPSNCESYGRLYTWAAAVDSAALVDAAVGLWSCGYGEICNFNGFVRGVCPKGWHLPSQVDWETLLTSISSIVDDFAKYCIYEDAGKKLKTVGGWVDGSDTYAFSALAAGERLYTGIFAHMGSYARFWTSTDGKNFEAYNLYIDDNYGSVILYRGDSSKNDALSVRCLKD